MSRIIIFSVSLICFLNGYGQTDTLNRTGKIDSPGPSEQQSDRHTKGVTDGPVYKLKPVIDIPLTVAATAFDLHAFKVIYSKPNTTPERIALLKKGDLNALDRWAADVYHESAAKTSDMLFYGSMPLPLLLFLDKDIRKDAAKIAFLYWETMSITGIFYTGTAYLVDRYRPFAYVRPANSDLQVKQTDGNAKNSFLAGHPALVATSTFFMAKVYSDYHPESGFKYVLYGLAIAATGTTVYLRHMAGRHFPSDLIVGTAMGTLTGILVPHFHKQKRFKNTNISIIPFTGQSHGLAMIYKL